MHAGFLVNGCKKKTQKIKTDLQDFNQNIFDEDEIIREYAPHHKRPSTSAPPTSYYHSRPYGSSHWSGGGGSLHELDLRDYYNYHPVIYNKASLQNPCSERQYRCGNNVCIPLHLRCDGFYHCNDMTDEMNCDQYRADLAEQKKSPSTESPPPANIVKLNSTAITPRNTRPTTTTPTTTSTTSTTTTTTTPAPSRF